MSILNHATLGTNDLQRAEKFYTAALGALGIKSFGMMNDTGYMYGGDHPQFLILKPRNGQPATHGNGSTLGFVAPSRAAVHKFHEAGLANGGTDEGEPGPRAFAPTAYGAYLRDPDGNKICAYCFAPE